MFAFQWPLVVASTLIFFEVTVCKDGETTIDKEVSIPEKIEDIPDEDIEKLRQILLASGCGPDATLIEYMRFEKCYKKHDSSETAHEICSFYYDKEVQKLIETQEKHASCKDMKGLMASCMSSEEHLFRGLTECIIYERLAAKNSKEKDAEKVLGASINRAKNCYKEIKGEEYKA